MSNNPLRIAVVDDHRLFREGLMKLILSLDSNFKIVLEATNGQDFLDKKTSDLQLDIVIVDIDMPIMNGFELAQKLMLESPEMNVLALTMHSEDEQAIIRMIRSGVKGYLSKDIEPDELKQAIDTVASGNFHFNEALSGKLLNMVISDLHKSAELFKENEIQFLRLCCSELTYKEIADRMFLSPKTIDGYRAALFERLNARSRVGLVLLAVKNGWVDLNDLP